MLGGQEKRKDKKTRKSKSEGKMVNISLASLFPARKQEAVTQGGTRGIDYLTRRGTQGACIVKGWEAYLGSISQQAALQVRYRCGRQSYVKKYQTRPDALKNTKRVKEVKVGDSERRKDRRSRRGTDVKEGENRLRVTE